MNNTNSKYILLFFLLSLKSLWIIASPYTDSLTNELHKAISQTAVYEDIKLKRIEGLKNVLNKSSPAEPNEQYNFTFKIYEEYKTFNYDSAFLYVNNLLVLANRLNDTVKIIQAKVSQSFILLSAGMFKETFESLNSINISGVPDSLKAEYYTLTGRLYYDLADYNGDHFHVTQYNRKATNFIDSALKLYPVNSFAFQYFSGLRNLKADNLDSAAKSLEALHVRKDLTLHQLALVTSTLSRIYTLKNLLPEATGLLIEAAIADIKSSTKETIALFNLADIFYQKGDLKNAAVFIQKANEDAVSYGARQRKAQINPLLQLIQSQKIISVEEQRKNLLIFIVFISFLLLIVIVFAIIILRQIKKIKIARAKLIEANNQLSAANQEKEIFNLRLQKSNARLLEADKIKEEYIGYFFNLDSELFLKIEKFKTALDKKIAEDRLADIKFIVNKFNLKDEKEDVLKSFDKVFLKLFPDFVSIFNSLFREEDQVKLKEDQLLNTELRIFALIRMGITENEKIAQILGYSVNTIYTYKTKIKNKSLVANEAFEEKIMQQVQVVATDPPGNDNK
jgi:Domain of unknown function (DUF6377)